MDIILLSKLLKDLLMNNDRVSLPGIGSYISEIAPSVFSDRALVIHPPFRRILFRTSEIWNDELLEKKYSELKEITIEKSKDEIATFLKAFKEELNARRSVKIPEFGTMKATGQNDYFFVLDKGVFIYPDSFGLEPIHIRPLTKPGVVEKLTEKVRVKVRERVEESKKPRKSNRRAIIILSILMLIIALAVFSYVFKEQLNPIWEWILYSKDERAILHLKN